ncbi:MAG TPA: hypothetical protein VHQ99_00605 [Gaiellaceae bacterium]|jgi:hypothetical protein|nr:hypothetical protein [Gaiellaceae bacterium]
MVTAAARPPVFWIGEDRERVRGWPIGAALLEALGDMNEGVRDALADERARLAEHGYPADLPLPALWWNSSASAADDAVAKPRLVALASAPG